MRILGVDPGTVVVGFAVIEQTDRDCRALEFGCFRLQTQLAFPQKLKKIYEELSKIILEFRPDEFAIEDVFYAENAKVAIKMGHARGVALLAAVNHEIPTSEYSPKEIKQAVVGNGAASKEQVQRMVKQLLRLNTLPSPLDVSDALAVALCHLHRAESRL
jgi:crossover junction endodeoxyribonuclease RuvC